MTDIRRVSTIKRHLANDHRTQKPNLLATTMTSILSEPMPDQVKGSNHFTAKDVVATCASHEENDSGISDTLSNPDPDPDINRISETQLQISSPNSTCSSAVNNNDYDVTSCTIPIPFPRHLLNKRRKSAPNILGLSTPHVKSRRKSLQKLAQSLMLPDIDNTPPPNPSLQSRRKSLTPSSVYLQQCEFESQGGYGENYWLFNKAAWERSSNRSEDSNDRTLEIDNDLQDSHFSQSVDTATLEVIRNPSIRDTFVRDAVRGSYGYYGRHDDAIQSPFSAGKEVVGIGKQRGMECYRIDQSGSIHPGSNALGELREKGDDARDGIVKAGSGLGSSFPDHQKTCTVDRKCGEAKYVMASGSELEMRNDSRISTLRPQESCNCIRNFVDFKMGSLESHDRLYGSGLASRKSLPAVVDRIQMIQDKGAAGISGGLLGHRDLGKPRSGSISGSLQAGGFDLRSSTGVGASPCLRTVGSGSDFMEPKCSLIVATDTLRSGRMDTADRPDAIDRPPIYYIDGYQDDSCPVTPESPRVPHIVVEGAYEPYPTPALTHPSREGPPGTLTVYEVTPLQLPLVAETHVWEPEPDIQEETDPVERRKSVETDPVVMERAQDTETAEKTRPPDDDPEMPKLKLYGKGSQGKTLGPRTLRTMTPAFAVFSRTTNNEKSLFGVTTNEDTSSILSTNPRSRSHLISGLEERFVVLPRSHKARLARQATFGRAVHDKLKVIFRQKAASMMLRNADAMLYDVITRSNLENPDLCGWLFDLDTGQRMWAILADMVLCLFADKMAEHPVKVMILPGYEVKAIVFNSAKKDGFTNNKCDINDNIHVDPESQLWSGSNSVTISGLQKFQFALLEHSSNPDSTPMIVFGVENRNQLNLWMSMLKVASNLDLDLFEDSDSDPCVNASSDTDAPISPNGSLSSYGSLSPCSRCGKDDVTDDGPIRSGPDLRMSKSEPRDRRSASPLTRLKRFSNEDGGVLPSPSPPPRYIPTRNSAPTRLTLNQATVMTPDPTLTPTPLFAKVKRSASCRELTTTDPEPPVNGPSSDHPKKATVKRRSSLTKLKAILRGKKDDVHELKPGDIDQVGVDTETRSVRRSSMEFQKAPMKVKSLSASRLEGNGKLVSSALGLTSSSSLSQKLALKATSIKDKVMGVSVARGRSDQEGILCGEHHKDASSSYLNHKQMFKWAKVWCVKSDGYFYVYKSKSPMESSILTLPLAECSFSLASTDKTKRSYSFKLCQLNARGHYFAADDLMCLTKWMKCIKDGSSLPENFVAPTFSKPANRASTGSIGAQSSTDRASLDSYETNHSQDSDSSRGMEHQLSSDSLHKSPVITPKASTPESTPVIKIGTKKRHPTLTLQSLGKLKNSPRRTSSEASPTTPSPGESAFSNWSECHPRSLSGYSPAAIPADWDVVSSPESESDVPEDSGSIASGDVILSPSPEVTSRKRFWAGFPTAMTSKLTPSLPKYGKNSTQMKAKMAALLPNNEMKVVAGETEGSDVTIATKETENCIYNRHLPGPNNDGLLMVTDENVSLTNAHAELEKQLQILRRCSLSDGNLPAPLLDHLSHVRGLVFPPGGPTHPSTGSRQPLPIPTPARELPGVRAGYLDRMGADGHWENVWCVVCDDSLYIYDAPIADEAVDCLHLNGAIGCKDPSNESSSNHSNEPSNNHSDEPTIKPTSDPENVEGNSNMSLNPDNESGNDNNAADEEAEKVREFCFVCGLQDYPPEYFSCESHDELVDWLIAINHVTGDVIDDLTNKKVSIEGLDLEGASSKADNESEEAIFHENDVMWRRELIRMKKQSLLKEVLAQKKQLQKSIRSTWSADASPRSSESIATGNDGDDSDEQQWRTLMHLKQRRVSTQLKLDSLQKTLQNSLQQKSGKGKKFKMPSNILDLMGSKSQTGASHNTHQGSPTTDVEILATQIRDLSEQLTSIDTDIDIRQRKTSLFLTLRGKMTESSQAKKGTNIAKSGVTTGLSKSLNVNNSDVLRVRSNPDLSSSSLRHTWSPEALQSMLSVAANGTSPLLTPRVSHPPIKVIVSPTEDTCDSGLTVRPRNPSPTGSLGQAETRRNVFKESKNSQSFSRSDETLSSRQDGNNNSSPPLLLHTRSPVGETTNGVSAEAMANINEFEDFLQEKLQSLV